MKLSRCYELAAQCKSKSEFFRKHPIAYFVSWKNGWLDVFFSDEQTEVTEEVNEFLESTGDSEIDLTQEEVQMVDEAPHEEVPQVKAVKRGRRKKYVWTDDTCIAEGRKYRSRTEFFTHCQTGYNYAKDHGLLDDIYGEFRTKQKKYCKKIAQSFGSLRKFKKNEKYMYLTCLKRGWIDEFFPGEVSKKKDTIRKKIIDYAEASGQCLTRKDLQKVMLKIAGQPENRLEWGVSYLDNVSWGNTIFVPSFNDRRYMKPVNGTKPLKYKVAKV